jgi:hypothetical protein
MKRGRRWTIGFALALTGIASLLGVPAADSQFDTTCASWNNSSVQYLDQYGGYCGGTGGSCAECSIGSATGYSVCVRDSFGMSVCTDYQY